MKYFFVHPKMDMKNFDNQNIPDKKKIIFLSESTKNKQTNHHIRNYHLVFTPKKIKESITHSHIP
jgi:hypothetical protein